MRPVSIALEEDGFRCDIEWLDADRVGPVVFDIDGDDATARGYSLLITRNHAGLAIEAANFNRWRFRRESGSWKIVERAMRPIGSAQVADLLAPPS